MSDVALVGGGSNPAAGRNLAGRTTACCFWTNCPSSSARCWR
ncbi:MAG: hypothetical protein WKG07_01555 [Hymenobacter sp.]